MSDNVVSFNGITRLDIDPDQVLNAALGSLDSVVVIGFDDEGGFYFASSTPDGGNVLWLLELAKKRLLEAADDYEGD